MMTKKTTEPTQAPRERAFLVGVDLRGGDKLLSIGESLAELVLLADTAGLDVVGEISQKMDSPNVNTFIGPGKVDEVKALVEELDANVVLFDEELSARHLRELEEAFGANVRVVDRTALILDIFAQHASTREGALQVELAQYEYRLPRLTRAWTHLARQTGGGGGRTGTSGGVGLRGPGETQLEVDRREIRRRMSHLKQQLEKVRTAREQYRRRRKKSEIPIVALVGYTNAGKSTLLNRLSDAEVYTANQLFATLDPTTRRVELPGGHVALFTDTVGFIHKLPTSLVAAFRATLEEIAEADLLLHVVDVTHPEAQQQAKVVVETLDEIEADHIPVLTALNKIDKLQDPQAAMAAVEQFPNSVAISATKNMGIEDLLTAVAKNLFETFSNVKVKLPYAEGGLISLFHEQGQLDKEEPIPGGVIIEGRVPGRLVARFTPFKWIGDKESGFVNGYRGLIDLPDEEGDDGDDSEI